MRKCWICGEEATVFPEIFQAGKEYWRYKDYGAHPTEYLESKRQRGYCALCAEKEEKRRQAEKKEYVRLKKSLMFERAVRLLERQPLDIYDYEEAIKAVGEYAEESPDKFDSADEIIAAIILVDNELDTKIHPKVGKYEVDFMLPTLKIVLEVDGYLHAGRLYFDNERDKAIRNELGHEWEIVRIKTEYLEKNAELLVEAIKTIKNEKQKLRAAYGGELPEWYSKREKAKRPKKQAYGDELLL